MFYKSIGYTEQEVKQDYKGNWYLKGYREIEKDPDEYSESELNEILGGIITSQDGIPKPMLAKQTFIVSPAQG